jgi:hypothetical protein
MQTTAFWPRTVSATLAALITACAVLALYQYTAPGHALPTAIFAPSGNPPRVHKTLPPI